MSGSYFLILIGPYSHHDLALLALIEEVVTDDPSLVDLQSVPIDVADLMSYQTIESPPCQTPLTLLGKDGIWTETNQGKPGRDLVAHTPGISAEALNEKLIGRVPKYVAP